MTGQIKKDIRQRDYFFKKARKSSRDEDWLAYKTLFTWSGGPRSSGVGFFCFHALGDTKQKKPTPLDRVPPLRVKRVLIYAKSCHELSKEGKTNIQQEVN